MATAEIATRKATAPYRMPYETYRAMGEQGLLPKAQRVVLVDGVLVRKMTKNTPHCVVLGNVAESVRSALPAGWMTRQEMPIRLVGGPLEGSDSAPEPDLVVVPGRPSTYLDDHPGPGQVALLIEVADSSLEDDRENLARYAWFGIRLVWIVNVRDQVVEVHSDPTGPIDGPTYRRREIKAVGDSLEIPLGDSVVGPIAVAALFD